MVYYKLYKVFIYSYKVAIFIDVFFYYLYFVQLLLYLTLTSVFWYGCL